MGRYLPTVDLWSLPADQIATLQRGQWVSAGPLESPLQRGIFCGVRASGSVVVAWMGNARGRYREYRRTLMNYGSANHERLQA